MGKGGGRGTGFEGQGSTERGKEKVWRESLSPQVPVNDVAGLTGEESQE